ncbi:hypothetical protein V8F33_013592 [Rhypophila sp. PSN 637]
MSAPPEKQSGPGPNNTGDLASRASQRQASILRSDAETRDLVLLKKWPVVPPGGDYTALHCFLVLYQNLLRMVLRRGAKVDSIEKIAESFFSEELVLWKEFCKPLESRNWLWEKLESTANSIVKPDGPVRFVQMMDKVWTQLWQHDYLRLYTTELKKPGQELTPLPLDAGHYSWNALRWNGIEDIGSSIERVFSYNTTPIPGSDDLMVINQKFPAVLTISYKSEHPVPDIWERAQGLPRLFNYRQIPLLHDTTSWRWCACMVQQARQISFASTTTTTAKWCSPWKERYTHSLGASATPARSSAFSITGYHWTSHTRLPQNRERAGTCPSSVHLIPRLKRAPPPPPRASVLHRHRHLHLHETLFLPQENTLLSISLRGRTAETLGFSHSQGRPR